MAGKFPCESTGMLFVLLDPLKIQVIVDAQIVAYARALLPASVLLNRTRYDPHITVVREEKVHPEPRMAAGKWHSQEVTFSYDPCVVPGEVYWWLRAWSDDLVEVRRSLGLPDLSWACRPPDGEDSFHITVGNTKGMT